MATANLCLHRGARVVARDELDAVEAPPPTETWFPLRHGDVLETVLATLQESGFEVRNSQLSLTRDNARFFGTLDLSTTVAGGTTLAVGVRNSVDKTFPLGFCAGCRVFVCDNLAFHSELLVARKHTLNGNARFQEAIALASSRGNPSPRGSGSLSSPSAKGNPMSHLETLWREFVDASPTNNDLCIAIATIEPLRAEAWQMLLDRGARNDDLRYIIEFVEPLRLDAARRLLTRKPTSEDLRSIIKSVPSLKNRARQMLWRNEKRQYLLDKMREAVPSP